MVQEHPILLYGFDFPTQNKLRFDHTWSAAFLTPRYTDEGHEELQACYWGEKKREIKYGNNIAVLFRSMLHLARVSGQLQEGFWRAIARGLNTNVQSLMETARILIEARKIQRSKPSKDVSDTARAVDSWIDFVDGSSRSRGHAHQLLPSQQVSIVLDFLRDLEGRLVNAAGVPLNPHIRPAVSFNSNGRRASSPGYPDNVSPTARGPPPPLSIKVEPRESPDRIPTGPRSARKRSASPLPAAYSPTAKRPNHNVGSLNSPRDKQPTSSELPRAIGSHVIMPPHSHSSEIPPPRTTSGDGIPNPPRQPLEGGGAMLTNRADELKAKLGNPDGHVQTLTAIKEVNALVSDVNEEVRGMRAVMEVMMDSMHAVADNLNAIKDDIVGLKAQKDGPESDVAPGDLSSILQPIQALSENFNLLKKEVTNLKNTPPPPPPQVVPQSADELRELKDLVLEQNSRISSLSSEVTRMQYQLGPPTGSAAPKSLRQALAAAEHDMRHHLHTVQTYYHQHTSGKNINRVSAESTADLIYALQQGLKSAQGGLQG
ncbi:hypothetical protein B0T16DRAFT_456471 [Cercophora newfieldiana]|uniref:Uncharacterized protein n=1 Tax=Cercophora newfieldiana TaxID=92897 RepID=A0AA39YAG0_9PEZI|nr:hypothetical protein B0T16DRAFT_456471 [Cercophora newfieldiana]